MTMRSTSTIDAEAIRELARLLDETGLTEIEIAQKDSRIRVVRHAAPAAVAVAAAPAMTAPQAAAVAPAPAAAPVPADHPGAVKSPMVGVAYLRADPNAKPFVQPGDRVAEGQTVLLIEAMKTFNQIKAPRGGTVAQIMVADGTPVEYAEVLMVIE
jgi:acetyl-CoA carboxylase biotin carboxyl carrier protein